MDSLAAFVPIDLAEELVTTLASDLFPRYFPDEDGLWARADVWRC